MVKVADRMRWGFVPAQVRFPPYLKCKIHHSGTSSDTASTISNNENLEAESANWSGQHQPVMADALETLQTLAPTHDVDVLERELEASKAELTKSRMVIGMLRSPGLPAVTVKPLFLIHIMTHLLTCVLLL